MGLCLSVREQSIRVKRNEGDYVTCKREREKREGVAEDFMVFQGITTKSPGWSILLEVLPRAAVDGRCGIIFGILSGCV